MKYLFYIFIIGCMIYLAPLFYSIAQVIFFEQFVEMTQYATYTN